MNNSLKTAFTLVELLVVIAIVGILSGLIIVGMSSSVNSARIAKAQIFSASLRDSLLNSLISEWKFDELPAGFYTGTVKDTWGTNDGTYNAGTGDTNDKTASGTNCIYGKCLYFDGINDYLNCGTGSSLQITGSITLEAWMNSSYSGWNTIFDKDTYDNNGYFFGTGGSGLLYFFMFSGTIARAQASSTVVTDGKWHNVTVVYDGYKTIYYVDGVNVHTANWGTYLSLGNDPARNLIISIATKPFNGYLDALRIYSSPINSSRIKQNYYAGLNRLLSNSGLAIDDYRNRITGLIENLAIK